MDWIIKKVVDLLVALVVSTSSAEAASSIAKVTWYGIYDGSGECTASGALFNVWNPHIVASKELAFGTRLKLTNPQNKETLCVEVQDRGPFVEGRTLDLTLAGALELNTAGVGVANLVVEKKQCFIPAKWVVEEKQAECGFTQVAWVGPKQYRR